MHAELIRDKSDCPSSYCGSQLTNNFWAKNVYVNKIKHNVIVITNNLLWCPLEYSKYPRLDRMSQNNEQQQVEIFMNSYLYRDKEPWWRVSMKMDYYNFPTQLYLFYYNS